MSKHLLITIALLLTSCGSGGGGDSHENSVDTVNYEICNEDGTINDLSTTTEQAADEVAFDDSGVVAENATTESTPELENVSGGRGGLSPVVPNDGIGVLKRAVLEIGQAEECAANQDCIIKATDGTKASVEHCGNVTIVLVPR